MPTGTGTITYTFSQSIDVTDVAVFTFDQTQIKSFTVSTKLAAASYVDESPVTIDSKEFMHVASFSSPKTIDSLQIKFELMPNLKTFQGLCRIGIFSDKSTGIKIKEDVTEPSWTPSTTDFNLLSDSTKTIALPQLWMPQNKVVTHNWTVYRTSDDADMVSLMPSNFSIGATELTVTSVIDDFQMRKDLFGTTTYYF